MSEPKRKIYWDSGCFICFLNEDERARGNICDDVLKHASAGEFDIWISVWVMTEVIRPRRRGKAPLPEWAVKAIEKVPEVKEPLEELWMRYQRNNPIKKLTPEQIALIQAMFEWPFIKKVQVDEVIARKAIEICHTYNMGAGDAIHAATAIQWKCDVIQRWDKDYSKVSHLIPSEEPKFLSEQAALIKMNSYAPNPEDFEEKDEQPTQQTVTTPTIPGSGNTTPDGQAGAKEAPKTEDKQKETQ